VIRNKAHIIGYAALAGLLLTGCRTSTSDNAAPASAPGPAAASAPAVPANNGGGSSVACDLITEQDASTAIGSPAGPGTPGGTAALSECVFDESALVISMKRPGKELYDSSRAQLKAGQFTDVPDVGDGGFETGSGQHVILEFYRGDVLVNILLATTDPSPKDAIIALAKVAAAHL
jgi:hypothetical protein